MFEYLVTCSGGNDSVALIQWMIEGGRKFAVVYNNTGWASDDWPERMELIKNKLESNNIPFIETNSEGMVNLVSRKKGWPMPASKMQWCTHELKEKPTLKLLEKIDPNKQLTIVTGRRRQESQNRSDLPLWQPDSSKHGGREVWNPLYLHQVSMRDQLINRFGMQPLPHSSKECWPCVCANKDDLARLSEDPNRIMAIEILELEMGFTKNKKPRTMFRPYRVGNGVGISQAVEWGCGKRGWKSPGCPDAYKYDGIKPLTESDSDIAYEDNVQFRRQCDGGYCGD